MKATYKHANIVAGGWQKRATFYERERQILQASGISDDIRRTLAESQDKRYSGTAHHRRACVHKNTDSRWHHRQGVF